MLIRFPDAEGLRLGLMLPDPKTASDLADDARGELHACVNRLRFVSGLLEELPDSAMDMSSRLELLLYHADAYYAAAYRIRDLLQHFPPLQLSEAARGKRTALWNPATADLQGAREARARVVPPRRCDDRGGSV